MPFSSKSPGGAIYWYLILKEGAGVPAARHLLISHPSLLIQANIARCAMQNALHYYSVASGKQPVMRTSLGQVVKII